MASGGPGPGTRGRAHRRPTRPPATRAAPRMLWLPLGAGHACAPTEQTLNPRGWAGRARSPGGSRRATPEHQARLPTHHGRWSRVDLRACRRRPGSEVRESAARVRAQLGGGARRSLRPVGRPAPEPRPARRSRLCTRAGRASGAQSARGAWPGGGTVGTPRRGGGAREEDRAAARRWPVRRGGGVETRDPSVCRPVPNARPAAVPQWWCRGPVV